MYSETYAWKIRIIILIVLIGINANKLFGNEWGSDSWIKIFIQVAPGSVFDYFAIVLLLSPFLRFYKFQNNQRNVVEKIFTFGREGVCVRKKMSMWCLKGCCVFVQIYYVENRLLAFGLCAVYGIFAAFNGLMTLHDARWGEQMIIIILIIIMIIIIIIMMIRRGIKIKAIIIIPKIQLENK